MFDDHEVYDEDQWQDVLLQLARIREGEDIAGGSIEFIRQQLIASDDRVRAAAVLTANACIFEPYILDLVIDIAQNDGNDAVRRAAIQSLAAVIQEGVEQDLEDAAGASTYMDDAEEWDEFQTGSLRDQYLQVKNYLFDLLEEDEQPELQEMAVGALADLGYISEIREHIAALFDSPRPQARLVAVRAMGKYPHFWEDELAATIAMDTPAAVLKEAISASYSSQSDDIVRAVEGILNHEDAEVIRYALLTLANLNRTPNLIQILQQFSLHVDTAVQEAARDGIEQLNRINFEEYMRDDLGMDD